MERNSIPDGLQEIAHEMPVIMNLIADTARWVHPEVFKSLPVWRPDIARTSLLYKADWVTPATNKGSPKSEGNVAAQSSLLAALGVVGAKPTNWTTCHIWGYDDGAFSGKSRIVQDRRFYSCVGNMVLLPTPLKGFTDAVPAVKRQLRVCAFHLYGWVCEHETVAGEAESVRSGEIPEGYPKTWPTADRRILPSGTGPYSETIKRRIRDRKHEISRCINTEAYAKYPRDAVRDVLTFWKIDLNTLSET